MNVVIASLRTPKIEGAKRGLIRAACVAALDPASFQFSTVDTPSGVDDTPRTLDELIQGARNRATKAFPSGHNNTISIGVEGGLFQVHETTFLQSWACVHDGVRFTFGASGAIAVPAPLAAEVMEKRIDLGIAIDAFAGSRDIRSKQGTWGVLTDDEVTREDSFNEAVFYAALAMFKQF